MSFEVSNHSASVEVKQRPFFTKSRIGALIATITAVFLIVIIAVLASGILGGGTMYFAAAGCAIGLTIATILAMYFCNRSIKK